jgi:hypothetical protein
MSLIWINNHHQGLTHTLVTGFGRVPPFLRCFGGRPNWLVSLLGLGVRFGAPFFCLRFQYLCYLFVNKYIVSMGYSAAKADCFEVLLAYQNPCARYFLI